MTKWLIALGTIGLWFVSPSGGQAVNAVSNHAVSVASFQLTADLPSLPTPPAPTEPPSPAPTQKLPATGNHSDTELVWVGLVILFLVILQFGRKGGRYAT